MLVGILTGEVVKEVILTLQTQVADLVEVVVLLQDLFQVFTKEQSELMARWEVLVIPVIMVLQEHL